MFTCRVLIAVLMTSSQCPIIQRKAEPCQMQGLSLSAIRSVGRRCPAPFVSEGTHVRGFPYTSRRTGEADMTTRPMPVSLTPAPPLSKRHTSGHPSGMSSGKPE